MRPEGEELRNLVVIMSAMGCSRRKIARELKMSRNTVRRILNSVRKARERGHSALPPPPVSRGSQLDEHEDYIKEQLEKYPDLTAVRMHEKLCDRGFGGGYTIV